VLADVLRIQRVGRATTSSQQRGEALRIIHVQARTELLSQLGVPRASR
jgi:hypothetical protein